MKSKLLAIFTIFAVPLLYHYDETAAVVITSIFSSLFVLFHLWEQRSFSLQPNKFLNTLILLIFVWLLTVGNSVILSCSSYGSWAAFIKVCTLLLLCYLTTCQLSKDSNSYIDFYRIATLTGFLQGITAICEYIEAPEIPKTWLDPASKELFRTRCCGILTDPNIFAAFLSSMFIFTIALIIRSENKKEQIFSSISLVLCGTGIIMTLSRGGWVALFAALVAFIISLFIAKNKPQKFPLKLLGISAITLLIIFFAGPFKYRLFSITKPSDMTFYQRTLINKGIFGSINKLPIAGHGIHTFNQVYPLYRIVGGDYPMYAHNEYLQSMIETGFLSIILLIAITICLFIIIYKSAKQNKFDNLVFSSVFISLLIQNLSGFSSRIFPTSVLIAISIGGILASQLVKQDLEENVKTNQKEKVIKYGLFALLLLVLPSSIQIYITQYNLNKANKLISAGKINEAVEVYQKLLNNQPNNPTAANSLGMIQLINKQPEKAVETWKKAFEHNKFEATFPVNIARLYSSNNVEQADYYYKKALELDPASENYRLEYAKFLIQQNKNKEAKEILEKGLTYSPGFHNVYTGFQEMEKLLSTL